jgi:hypothetical protein
MPFMQKSALIMNEITALKIKIYLLGGVIKSKLQSEDK